MKILVTGITGHVGAPLLRALAQTEGIAQIYGVYRDAGKLEALKRGLAAAVDKAPIEFILHDLREPFDGLTLEVDVILHSAALRGASQCNGDARDALLANALGTKHLADFALRNGVASFVFFSIQSVYDRACTVPIREDAPLRGDEMYQISKIAAEMEVAAFLGSRLNHQILRLAHVYGYEGGQGLDGILKAFLREVPEGRIRVDGDGRQTVCFLHIQDLCDLVKRIIVRPPESGIYNVCSETLSIRDLADQFAEASARRFGKTVPIWFPEPDKAMPGSLGLDLTKLRLATGWTPRQRVRDFVGAMVDGLS